MDRPVATPLAGFGSKGMDSPQAHPSQSAATSGPLRHRPRDGLPFWQIALIATAASALTLWIRLAMEGPLGGRPTLVLFVLPILLSAWPGGLRGGLLATALCELGSIYYLYPPTHNFFIETPVERWQALFLGLSGISISAMSEALHRARRRARRAARDARQAEAHARASEARLQTVTENARVGLVLLDPERRYTYVNAMCARMLGLASREVIGRRVADVLPDLYD